MAAPAQEPREPRLEPSFDLLGKIDRPWTAQMALDLLPENNGPKVEVLYGSVVVSPHAGYDHQAVARKLPFLLHEAARAVGLWAYPECNVVRGDDLFIPDFAVLRRSGAGKITMPISDVLLIGETVSPGNRRKDLIDRPREYAAAGVPYFMRVDFRNRISGIVLHELADGEYRPVVAAAAGGTFTMSEPFAFSVDPAGLMDDEDDED
jgi:Uma2 family endonuclease